MARARLNVAVVQGGPSTEAEVSRASARAVADALREAGHAPVRLELDGFLAESLRTGGYDVAFPVAHGAVGEDGSLQGLFEVLAIAYVGSGVLASALAMDKPQARRVFEQAGLPVARGMTLRRAEEGPLEASARVLDSLGARVVVKPSASGSAIGVTRFETEASRVALAAAIESAFALGDAALVEQFISGRETTCGVLDLGFEMGSFEMGGGIRAFPPTEIQSPKDAFYTYEARYAPGRSVHVCPAPIGEALTARVQEIATRAHRALGCRDLSRADMIVGESDVTLLEVNTLPGFTGTSLYPEAAAALGISFPSLCDALARNAHARGATARNPPRPLPT